MISRLEVEHGASSSLLGPVDPSFRCSTYKRKINYRTTYYQGGGLAVGARCEARVEDHAAVAVQPEGPQVMRPLVLGAHLQRG